MGSTQNMAGGYRDERLAIDFELKRVTLDSQPLTLTHKEYELLTALVRQAGDIVRREVLLREVWEYGPGARTRTVDVHIRRLRSQLGIDAKHTIETIFGSGYRFQPFPQAGSVKPGAGRTAIALGA